MKRICFLIASLLPLLILLASKNVHWADGQSTGTIEPASYLLEGLDAKEALALANRWQEGKSDVESFVTTEHIQFNFTDGDRVTINLPEDRLVVAIAPYKEKTHSCKVHYMSGCQGELINFPVKVTARQLDGTVLIDKNMQTMSNGFIELWLPRDLEIRLTIDSHKGWSEGIIKTFSDSNTCITTFQLS